MFRLLFFALILFGIISVAQAADISFPELTGRVVDNAHIIDAQRAKQIDQQIAEHEKQSSDQIVVVTVPTLNGISIEDYGYRLGRHWDIGQKGKNNGVLLIIAPNERKMRIEVGYGLEGVLTDAASAMIIQYKITPSFKQGDYTSGIEQGVTAIIEVIKGENVNDLVAQNDDPVHFLVILIFFLIFMFWLLRGRSSGGAGPFAAGLLMGGGFGDNDDDSGGGSSFGGGGGSFGGGGSSGSW